MCCRLWCWQKTLWVDRAPRRDVWWCLWLCVSALSWYVGRSVLFPVFYFIWFLAWRWNLSLSPRKLSKMRSCFHCSLCWRSWIWLASWVRGRRFFLTIFYQVEQNILSVHDTIHLPRADKVMNPAGDKENFQTFRCCSFVWRTAFNILCSGKLVLCVDAIRFENRLNILYNRLI